MKNIVEFLKKLRKDDWMHFTVSLLLAFVVSLLASEVLPEGTSFRLTAALMGAIVSVAIGMYKEVFMDESVSLADLLADASGAVVGAIMGIL